MSEHIVYIPEDMKDGDELFVGNLRKDKELIRCKDCIWFTGEQKYCSNDHWTPTGDGYCNFAQRKEE